MWLVSLFMIPTSAQPKRASAHHSGTPANGRFLRSLGSRVRELRNQRGLTRKQMSEEADVSERHLAQLEAGEGNISVVLLQRIAEALNEPIANLFVPLASEPAEKRLIQRFLERLPEDRLKDVVSRLVRDFGHDEKARKMRIALIGMRGAGKSTLGSKLAADTNHRFVELDSEIEKNTGMPLGEI